MSNLKHGDFIEKMARYKPVYDASISNPASTWRELGAQFKILPVVAKAAVKFVSHHANDPIRPEFADETHKCVVRLSEYFDLTSPESIRAGLLANFKAEPPDGKLNRRHSVRPSILKKVMKASGLEWFEKDEVPYIHWAAK